MSEISVQLKGGQSALVPSGATVAEGSVSSGVTVTEATVSTVIEMTGDTVV